VAAGREQVEADVHPPVESVAHHERRLMAGDGCGAREFHGACGAGLGVNERIGDIDASLARQHCGQLELDAATRRARRRR
jgi:hypothetical protein